MALPKGLRSWYNGLPVGSILSFRQLYHEFTQLDLHKLKDKESVASLLIEEQASSELIHDLLKQLN